MLPLDLPWYRRLLGFAFAIGLGGGVLGLTFLAVTNTGIDLLFGSAGAEVLAQDEGTPRPRLKLPRARSDAQPAAPARPAAPVRRSPALRGKATRRAIRPSHRGDRCRGRDRR